MKIEYEAKFTNINKDEMRLKLKNVGANLVRPKFLQKRVVFNLPEGHKLKDAWSWIRVRDEGDKITMSLKVVDGYKIENQKELCLEVNSLKEAELFLTTIGCRKKSYQETKRELWMLDNVEITIDEWPFLEPFIEVEGESEKKVKEICEKMKLDYSKALFCAVGPLYQKKYNISLDVINNQTPRIVFGEENPFIKS